MGISQYDKYKNYHSVLHAVVESYPRNVSSLNSKKFLKIMTCLHVTKTFCLCSIASFCSLPRGNYIFMLVRKLKNTWMKKN